MFQFLLRLEDGDPNDPAVFVTPVPNWTVGETFLIGGGERLRILEIETEIAEELSTAASTASSPSSPRDRWRVARRRRYCDSLVLFGSTRYKGSMRRRVKPLKARAGVFVALLAFMLAYLAQSTPMSAARLVTIPRVVVTKSGVVRGAAGSDYATYGLVLRNKSRTTDALNLTVTVKALDKRGRAFTTDRQIITVVPAAKDFVVAGSLIWNVSLDLARIVTTVHVGKGAPRGRKLPSVTHIQLTTYGDLKVTLNNPYRKPLPESATVYGLFLDRQGHIVATDAELTNAAVPPHATVSMTLNGGYSTSSAQDSVASGRVSVDPCGGEFSPACPVAGAG